MPTTHRARHRSVVVALIGTFLMTLIPALPVAAAACPSSVGSLTTPGSPLTQNFDALSNVAGSTTNNLLLPGWYMTEAGGGARDNEQYAVDTGASTTGDTYSYGAAASTERAFGALRSGTLIPLYGAAFSNDTGSTISSLAVAYTGEEWRNGTAGRTDQINFEYSLDATDLSTGTWTGVSALNFVTPDTATAGAKNGNAAAERTALSSTITGLNIASGACVWFRWTDTDASGADDGLAVDDFSVTPNPTVPNLTINDVSLNEGNAGTTTFTFTVSLSAPARCRRRHIRHRHRRRTAAQPDDYTAKSLTGQMISAGNSTYTFDVIVNGDTTPEPNETFFVNVTNVTGATVADGQGAGTIVNDDVASVAIHDVQGNGASTPIPGATVTVEGVVTANFQGTSKLQGFFLQEEDADADADPATSEGIFVFCGGCSTIVAEGQRVRATGTVSEFNGMTEITASSAGSVVVTDAGNHLAEVTPSPIDLPIAGDVERLLRGARGDEGHLRRHADRVRVLRDGALRPDHPVRGRPAAAVHRDRRHRASPGHAAHVDDLARRKVTLDDDNNAQEAFLSQPERQPVRLLPAGQRRLQRRDTGHRLLPRRRRRQRPDRRPPVGIPGLRPRHVAHPPDDREPRDVHRRQPAAGDAARGRWRHQGRRHEPAQLLHHHRHDLQQQHRPVRPVRDPGLPRRRQRGGAQPAARTRLDRHLQPRTPTSTPSWSSRTRPRATPSPTSSARSTRAAAAPIRTPSSTPAGRSAPMPSACSRSTAPGSSRRSARRWWTSTRSTTGRRRRRRSTWSTPPTWPSASASRSSPTTSSRRVAPGTGGDADAG